MKINVTGHRPNKMYGYDGRVSENKIIKQKNIELCEPCSFAIAKILQNAKR